jgi:UDP-glucose 4-epimerase
MKILITGGCGFVGTNLIPFLLEQKHQIVVVDNLSHGTYINEVHNRTTFEQCDIRDKEHLDAIFSRELPDFVFHFAGLVSIYDCHRYTEEAITNNVLGTIIVFDLCVKYNVKKCIFSESSAVYENCDLPLTGYKEDQSDPTTLYATTKAATALIANSYARTRNFKFTALRYFNIAGPLQDYKRTVPPLFAGVALRLIGKNPPIVFGDGNRRRDFIHVDDVNNFHLLCISDERTDNETFNLGLGKSTSLYEIIDIVREFLQSDITQINHAPEINGEAFEIFANISKAKQLGWEPQKTINDAIIDTVRFLQSEIEFGNIHPDSYMNDLDIDKVKI